MLTKLASISIRSKGRLTIYSGVFAGNCAVVKPSEVAEATAELFTRLIPEYLDQVRKTKMPETDSANT